MLTLVPIWAVMGLSWNILSGYSGLISFGHAAFFGLGAYTVTLLLVHLDITPWFGIPAAVVVGARRRIVIGYPTFRLRGHYFALSMLAYPLALLYLFEWLGYQEVALPMKRSDAAWYMQFSDYHVYIGLGARAAGCRAADFAGGGALPLRPVADRDQAERARGRGGRRRHAALEDARHRVERSARGSRGRSLRGGAAGGDPADGVRHARPPRKRWW